MMKAAPYPEIFVDWNNGSPEAGPWLTTVGGQADFAKIGTTAEAAVGMRCIFYTDGDETGDFAADDAMVYVGTVQLNDDGVPVAVKDPGTVVLTRREMTRSGYGFVAQSPRDGDE